MADINGGYLADGVVVYYSTSQYDTFVAGSLISTIPQITNYYSNSQFAISTTGFLDFNYITSSTPPSSTTHYHKRAWSTTLSSYVEWESTTPNGAYPGGGTLDPTLGVILYTWVTTP